MEFFDEAKSDIVTEISEIQKPGVINFDNLQSEAENEKSFFEDITESMYHQLSKSADHFIFGKQNFSKFLMTSNSKEDFHFKDLKYLSTSNLAEPKSLFSKYHNDNLKIKNCHQINSVSESVILLSESEPQNEVINNTIYLDTENLEYTVFNYKHIVGCLAFIAAMGPLAGNIYIPAIPLLQQNLQLSRQAMNGSISVFMAVFCIFPLFWGALCDRYGRKIILLLGLALSLVSNTLLTHLGHISPQHIQIQLYSYRVIQGIAASCFISCGCAMIRDVVTIDQRATYMGYFFLGPNIAPVIAPILAGIILSAGENNIIDDIHWRWLFLILVILNVVGILITVFIIPETCRSLVGNGDPRWSVGLKEANSLSINQKNIVSKTKWKIHFGGLSKPITDNLTFSKIYEKPPLINLNNYLKVFKMQFILLISFSVALQFSLYYAFAVTFAHDLKNVYKFNNMSMAASYVVPGTGLIIGTLFSGKICDRKMKQWKQNDDAVYPEKRLIFQIAGIYCSCLGGMLYGWFLHFHMHIAAVFISSFILGLGLTLSTNASSTYASQIAKAQTGTAISIMNAMRNAGAAISSAIAYMLINEIGNGWFFTGISLITLASTVLVIHAMKAGCKKQINLELNKKCSDIENTLHHNLSIQSPCDKNMKTAEDKVKTEAITNHISITTFSNEAMV
ncbi:hypothetical protein QEN19_002004 [Hanseniaspora menglaensis]